MINTELLANKSLKNDFELYYSETKRLCSLDYDQVKIKLKVNKYI